MCSLPYIEIWCACYRSPVYKKENINARQPGRRKAFGALVDTQAEVLFDGYQKAKQATELDRVFLVTEATKNLQTTTAFSEAFTGTMRDMQSCGIASNHTGIPLWKLRENKSVLKQAFQGDGFVQSLGVLIEVSCCLHKLDCAHNHLPAFPPCCSVPPHRT